MGGVAMGDVQEQHDAPVLVYVTAASVQEAEHIAEELVRERLAACANIIPGMTSIYHWKGELQRDQEVVVMLKSRAARVEQISERVKQLHSYDCPCVIALPIVDGAAAYLAWLAGETQGSTIT